MTKYTQEKQLIKTKYSTYKSHGRTSILKGKIQKNLSSEKEHNIGNVKLNLKVLVYSKKGKNMPLWQKIVYT